MFWQCLRLSIKTNLIQTTLPNQKMDYTFHQKVSSQMAEFISLFIPFLNDLRNCIWIGRCEMPGAITL